MKRAYVFGLPALFALAALLGPAHAAEKADWFHEARWGVLLHYLGAPPSSDGGAELTAEKWNERIDAFDTAALAEQLASTGAKYCVFTIGQNSGHYCSPNATYDKIVGIRPSKCSRRDLIADLAKALAPHGIRLMVYLPSGAPAADPVARKKLQWRWGRPGGWQLPGEPTGGRLVEFQRNWEAVVRQWSSRWGRNVHGWWIDGCYFADEMYRHPDEPNFASFAAALKAGNPDSLVAFNPGVKLPVVCHSEHEDYTAGEVTLEKVPEALQSCPGRWIERGGKRVQYHLLSYLGTSWCRGERPALSDDVIIGYTRRLNQQGGVITWDVPISTAGEIPQPFIDQLTALGEALRFEVVPADESALHDDARAETVRERLWVWGHPAGVYNDSYLRPLEHKSTIEPVDAVRHMGLRNMIFVRYDGKPAPPFGDYYAPFQELDRVYWSLGAAGGATSQSEREAAFALADGNENVVGFILDDFFHEPGSELSLSLPAAQFIKLRIRFLNTRDTHGAFSVGLAKLRLHTAGRAVDWTRRWIRTHGDQLLP